MYTMQMVDDLRFPVDRYSTEKVVAHTATGNKTVIYRAYEHLPYVKQPVDAAYQSMDLWVPETVDGVPVETANAPILFVIGVGGYMSCNNHHPGMMPPAGPGGPGGPGGPNGPGGPLLPGLGGSEGPGQNKALAMAYGFVVAVPGCRGRDCRRTDGTYFGKAPAAIVDLKAAVRYLRHNRGRIPGDTERILSTGGSAGGALSCLLAASGNHPLYAPYLEKIGALPERDDIFASAAYSPIIDLEHADAGYEWEFGRIPCGGQASGPIQVQPGLVDQTLSEELRQQFVAYQDSLQLQGRGAYGLLTGENLQDYLLKTYLVPAASRYLAMLPEEARSAYLAQEPWISYDGEAAAFSFEAYLNHCGRMKGLPAFDDLSMAEPDLFGTETVKAQHFTEFSLRHDPSETATELTEELKQTIHLMNPMYFVLHDHADCAVHWWIRHGAADRDISLPIVTDLATALENQGKDVNARLVWDGGHCADDDPEGLLAWMLALR